MEILQVWAVSELFSEELRDHRFQQRLVMAESMKTEGWNGSTHLAALADLARSPKPRSCIDQAVLVMGWGRDRLVVLQMFQALIPII